MRNKIVIILCSTFISIAAIANSSYAQETIPDSKRYAAAECGAANFSQLTISDKGQAFNKSTKKRLKIVCPVVNDSVLGSGLKEVTIWLQKANTDNTLCWIHAARPSQQGGFYSFDYTSDSGRSVPLNIDSPFTSNISGIGDTHYVLGCDVDRRIKSKFVAGSAGYSGINSYWIAE